MIRAIASWLVNWVRCVLVLLFFFGVGYGVLFFIAHPLITWLAYGVPIKFYLLNVMTYDRLLRIGGMLVSLSLIAGTLIWLFYSRRLVDFQKDNLFVSVKSIDTKESAWLHKMQKHIVALCRLNATVDCNSAIMILDLRMPPGEAAAARPLVQYGAKNNVTVIIKELS